MTRAVFVAALAVSALARPLHERDRGGNTAAAQPPPGITRAELLDNATVLVARLQMAPGARETIHTHPFSAVVMQLDAGDVDMTIGGDHTRARREPGFIWFIPKETPHAAVNVGAGAFDVVTVAIKPTRTPAPAAPATDAPPGITRTTVLDNAETRVVRVQFAPGGREPVHTHPYDLLTIQLSRGRVEILAGSPSAIADRTIADREPGFVRFLPRDVPHAYASADTGPFEILSVSIK